MSDQTPNSTEDLNGSEPSMEDILASIRKIISEDEPVALESPEDIPSVDIAGSDESLGIDSVLAEFGNTAAESVSEDIVPSASLGSAESSSVDLNIDDVLAELEEAPPALEAEALALDELETKDDILDLLDDGGSVEAETGADALADIVEQTESAEDLLPDFDSPDSNPEEDLEVDALLEDILMIPDSDSAENLAGTAADELVTAEQSDLDLVKSLMADLADDPDDVESAEDLDNLLEIPDLTESAELASEDISDVVGELADEPEDDILGDILDMTMEDQLATQPDELDLDEVLSMDDVAAVEQENIAENLVEIEPEMAELELSEPEIELAESADDVPSLSEIAAAAEADAVEIETTSSAAAPAAALSAAGLVAAVGAKAVTSEPAEIETSAAMSAADESQDITTQDNTPSQSIEETSMPVKAVKTDAILDEVTESATAGAFAELNQVVEDKAIFNERGPRIGDLVQEALRPMLKEWLDANLKGIVERAVTKEVKRISKGN